MNVTSLFVYGTLRRALNCPATYVLKQHGRYITEGYFQGQLYDLGHYPGVVVSSHSNHRVRGEIYQLLNIDLALKLLDQYEGCHKEDKAPQEYKRCMVSVRTLSEQIMPVWIYLLNNYQGQKTLIESGDYVTYLAQTKAKTMTDYPR